jgi:cell division protein FtsI/penicillin-binding protein 2
MNWTATSLNAAYFDRIYGEGHWNYLTIRSLAIGQGELLITPIQMANMTATIANRGYYITPHLVKAIEGDALIDEGLPGQDITPASIRHITVPLWKAWTWW